MRVTVEELSAAFTPWDKGYREKPEEFTNMVDHLLRSTPEEYGPQATACLEAYVKRIRKESK
jgi:hypothetical protein